MSADGDVASGFSAEQCLDTVTFISSNSGWSHSGLQQSKQSNKTGLETGAEGRWLQTRGVIPTEIVTAGDRARTTELGGNN